MHYRVGINNDTNNNNNNNSDVSARRVSMHLLVDQIKTNEPELFGKKKV